MFTRTFTVAPNWKQLHTKGEKGKTNCYYYSVIEKEESGDTCRKMGEFPKHEEYKLFGSIYMKS